jgi:tetratricopeptide (TPR) repeat protein
VTDSGEVKSYSKDGKVTDYYELTRKASVEVRFTVLDKSGTVLGVSEVRGHAEKMTRDPDRDWVRKNSPAWDDLVKAALQQTPESFLHKIAPYFVTESRTFENGEAESIKSGNEAARKGDWGTAVQCWKDAEAGGNPKDKVAALYNLGIYDEVDGRLQDALSKFEEVKNLSNDAKYNKDISRTQARIAEEEKLRVLTAAPAPVPTKASAPAAGLTSSDGLQAWRNSPGLRVVREGSMHRFNWTPLPTAIGYHVFTSAGKGKPLSQLNHKLLVKPQLRAKALPRGKAFVQVVAFDQEGNEIAKTAVQTLTIP